MNTYYTFIWQLLQWLNIIYIVLLSIKSYQEINVQSSLENYKKSEDGSNSL